MSDLRDRAGAAATSGLGEIVEAVRARMAEGRSLPSERRLAEELGVKRHTLRKALGALREAGEIDPPARRAAAPPPSSDHLVELASPIEVIELRLALEPAFARLASVRASRREIERILAAATTAPGADAGKADLAFHSAVAEAARNNLGAAVYAMLRKVGTDSRVRMAGAGAVSSCPAQVERRDREHLRVAEAIAARDPVAAEEAMREHLLAVQRLILERIDPAGARAA